MTALFICPRCQNQDSQSIGLLNGQSYCRACIAFNGEWAPDINIAEDVDATLDLDYQFSKEQKQLGSELIECFDNKIHTLIHAVTGAGKTEIVYPVIAYAVEKQLRVGFAIPRRDVVIELSHRFKDAFPKLNIIAVYGGHHDELTGDIVMLTTHQIYRYVNYFDLLIVDEFDAFPFKENTVLDALLKRSLRGVLMVMSATPSSKMITTFSQNGHSIKRLWTRYHRQPLPVPNIVIRYSLFKSDYVIDAIKRYQKMQKPVLIFAPTIELAKRLFNLIRLFTCKGNVVHSKSVDRQQIIKDFRLGVYSYLISTSVLERGITLLNLQVIIYDAHHPIYDSAMLIQMAGRVGRKKEAPHGDVIYLAIRKTEAMKQAITEINNANRHL